MSLGQAFRDALDHRGEAPAGALPPRATPPLHGQVAVGIATFLGSLIAGAVLIARDLHRLGRRATAWCVVPLAIAASIGLGLLARAMPDFAMFVPLAGVAATRAAARALLAVEHATHEQLPVWHGVVVGLVTLAIILLAYVALR